jgi:hypothetical protein
VQTLLYTKGANVIVTRIPKQDTLLITICPFNLAVRPPHVARKRPITPTVTPDASALRHVCLHVWAAKTTTLLACCRLHVLPSVMAIFGFASSVANTVLVLGILPNTWGILGGEFRTGISVMLIVRWW